jgi:hypothetical protein
MPAGRPLDSVTDDSGGLSSPTPSAGYVTDDSRGIRTGECRGRSRRRSRGRSRGRSAGPERRRRSAVVQRSGVHVYRPRPPPRTPRVQRRHASHQPTPSDASLLCMVCVRVPYRLPPRPPPSLLPAVMPPARLRTPPRLRAPPYGASLARPGERRRLVGHGLRAGWLDRPVRKASRHANERATRGPTPRDVVRRACRTDQRSALHAASPTSLQVVHNLGRRPPTSLRNQRLQRIVPAALVARRHSRATHSACRCTHMDSTELSVAGGLITGTNTFSR